VTLCIIVADGARPDTLFGAMDAGHLPALAQLRAEGSAHTVSSVFPSVTGSAYAPFLLGLHPGRAGIPGLRWFDRARSATKWPAYSRSYVGAGAVRADSDLTREYRTLFEHEPRSLGAFTYIGRGLSDARRVGTGWIPFGAKMAWTHFRGDLESWLRFDRWIGEESIARIRAQRPRVAFIAHPGIDKHSHRFGAAHPVVLESMRTVDSTVAQLRASFASDGRAQELEIWVVSDHGHADLHRHEDLAGVIASWGHSVRAHPWVVGGHDVAVMVSGNAMAHLYLELSRTVRPGWEALRARWTPMLTQLLARESVDLAVVPIAPGVCEVFGRGRGHARVSVADDQSAQHPHQRVEHPHQSAQHPHRSVTADRISYHRISGDPLQLGMDLESLTATESWEATIHSEYPDALVQLIAISDAPRAGDIILSASPGWDLRTRWEPIVHVSGHGALHREQMLVPLIMSRAPSVKPRRTTDVFPSALAALGLPVPTGLDGVSFR